MKRRLPVCVLCAFSFLIIAQVANAQDKIEGPWMWMIVNTTPKGGAGTTNDDWIKESTGGKLTEDDVAKEGITDKVLKVKFKDYKWTEGKISPVGGNNVNDMLIQIKLGPGGDINQHCSYAVINAVATQEQNGVAAKAGSDDSIKIWMNGKVVHVNPVDRGAGDFQDAFKVDLKRGDNIFMVKVCEQGGGWSMFVGIDANLKYNLKFKGLPVEPAGKLATTWAEVKRAF